MIRQPVNLLHTEIEVPGDYYYMQFYEDYTAVEYFTRDSAGLIYGGTNRRVSLLI